MAEFKVSNKKRDQKVAKSEKMLTIQSVAGARGGRKRYKIFQRDTLESGTIKQRLVGAGAYIKGAAGDMQPNVWVEVKAK